MTTVDVSKSALQKRFDSKWVREADTPGCHTWLGARNRAGYGVIQVAGRAVNAHRVAWQLAHGDIPPGMFVCHRCDNPACVNAESHLFLGTHAENMADRNAKRRQARGARCSLTRYGDDMVAAIRLARAEERLPMQAIATRLGVSQSYVSAVCSGRVRHNGEALPPSFDLSSRRRGVVGPA